MKKYMTASGILLAALAIPLAISLKFPFLSKMKEPVPAPWAVTDSSSADFVPFAVGPGLNNLSVKDDKASYQDVYKRQVRSCTSTGKYSIMSRQYTGIPRTM